MSDQELPVEDMAIEEPASPENVPSDATAIDALDAFSRPDDDGAQVVDSESAASSSERPITVPEKFWDASTKSIRTDSLLKSYLQLEKKLGTMIPLPSEDDPAARERLHRALGRPESPDDYAIEARHELLSSDPEINSKLHAAGLTSQQAQLVYDLAAEHVLPLIEKVQTEASQAQELEQLASHFGGQQSWQAIAPQIKSWAAANLNEGVYDALCSSSDGIIAIHQMMQNREPSMISETAVPSTDVDKQALNQMMRDPKYWRDHDPAFVARVTEGYKRLYG